LERTEKSMRGGVSRREEKGGAQGKNGMKNKTCACRITESTLVGGGGDLTKNRGEATGITHFSLGLSNQN